MKRNLIFVSLMMWAISSLAIAETKVADISVKDLAQLIKKNEVKVFDANGAKTRSKHGIIPGAVMLKSYDEYDVAKVLPKNKGEKLVFYCANTKCSAAPAAAKRAMDSGYTNVSHLSVGIMGWKKSGQKSDTPK